MVERFTDRARRAIVLAAEDARSRRHAAVGPEHLLLGILREGSLARGKFLAHLRISPEALSAAVERSLSQTPTSVTSADPAFSPELKAVLEAALEEQRRQRHYLVRPEELLFVLLVHPRSTVDRILAAVGADLDTARLLTRLTFSDGLSEDRFRFIVSSKWAPQIRVTP